VQPELTQLPGTIIFSSDQGHTAENIEISVKPVSLIKEFIIYNNNKEHRDFCRTS
jgi:hypothetical protein